MQDEQGAKQQIVDRIKQSTNILVTVNSNPSVDALSAALGLALMLNKLDKHATAVFSGTIPPAINFLQPAKTFEHNVDSLRDFIIALDKEKADRLRYKVEDDVVKIFITPYRTTITQNDLQFSQGDFNVDLIIALGVEKQEELDRAITAHGRILHDATVVTINAAKQQSDLGSIDWQSGEASSLSEMLVGIAEDLQPKMLDQQISTALLTGIVAATDRFSNGRTTPSVMTMAAQLMAAGANQQLIANNLQTMMATPIRTASPDKKSQKIDKPSNAPSVAPEEKRGADGEMVIKHQKEEPVTAQQKPPAEALSDLELPMAPPSNNFADLKKAIEEDGSQKPAGQGRKGKGENKNDSKGDNRRDKRKNEQPKQPKAQPSLEPKPEGYVTQKPSWMSTELTPPTMGGTLSATAAQALEDRQHAEEDERNHTILSHDTAPTAAERVIEPLPPPPQQPASQPEPMVAPAPQPQPASVPPPALPSLDAMPLQTEPTIEQLENEAQLHAQEQAAPPPVGNKLDAARQAVDDALQATVPAPSQPNQNPVPPAVPSPAPEPTPAAPAVEPLPSPAQSQSSAPATPPSAPPAAAPAPLQMPEGMPPLPPLPPIPGFNEQQLPPPAASAPAPGPTPQLPPLPSQPAPPSQPSPPTDPAQYRIPGQ